MEFTNELLKMKPSRIKPKEGDIFIIQPQKSLYIYGKVIRSNIPNKDPMLKGWNVIYIYKKFAKEIVILENLDPQKLLIPPQIVNNQGWLKGYFMNIGFSKVTEEDFIEYGFWDVLQKRFVNEEGTPLGYEPKIWTDYGLGSYGIIGHDVQEALKKEPNLFVNTM